MYSFALYVIAVIVGLLLYFFYEEPSEEAAAAPDATKQARGGSTSSETASSRTSPHRKSRVDFRFSSLFSSLGLNVPGHTEDEQLESFTDHFTKFSEVSEACSKAGLESSSLVIGVDFTASNEWKGRKSFNQNCLHKLVGNKVQNPYQKVIWILGETLAPFDDDNRIPAFGFGDTDSKSRSVFPFKFDGTACAGFQEVLEWYNEVVRRITLSGPTNFAPIIRKAVELVQETHKYHILVIITDGQVTEEAESIEALVEASNHPLSIIAVGVGDGPWNLLERFDSHIAGRKFDNFRFVDYHRATAKSKSPDAAFALQALMEIPDQYKRIRELGYVKSASAKDSDESSPSGLPAGSEKTCSPKHDSRNESPKMIKPSIIRHRFSNISC